MAASLMRTDSTDYRVFDLRDPLYECGDDELCPECGAQLAGYDNLDFCDGVIRTVYHCTCGKVLTFNYFLTNVIAE